MSYKPNSSLPKELGPEPEFDAGDLVLTTLGKEEERALQLKVLKARTVGNINYAVYEYQLEDGTGQPFNDALSVPESYLSLVDGGDSPPVIATDSSVGDRVDSRASAINSILRSSGKSTSGSMESSVSIPRNPVRPSPNASYRTLAEPTPDSPGLTQKRWISPMDEFIKDPQVYFATVDILHDRIYELGHIALGAIKQGEFMHVLDLPAIEREMMPETDDNENGIQAMVELAFLLQRNIAMVSAIIGGLDVLTSAQLCNSKYNVIVVDCIRPGVLRVVPFQASTFQLLNDLLEELLSICSSAFDGALMKPVISDLSDVNEAILRSLDLAVPSPRLRPVILHQDTLEVCKSLSSTLSVLFLGLLSFSGSHIRGRGTDLAHDLIELQIETAIGPIFMSPRRLSCLDSFVKRPVWTFSNVSAQKFGTESTTDRYHLSTSVADFGDLWGPLNLSYIRDDFRLVTEIRVRGGAIRSIREQASALVNLSELGETPCHWYGWMDNDFGISHAPPFSAAKPLLIGGGEDDCFQVQKAANCRHTASYTSVCRAFELKTKRPSWRLDARSASVSTGQYTILSYGKTWKFDAGWTLKDVIVEDWVERVRNDPSCSHQPLPLYLDYLVIIEISQCTGHSRRISIWSLLKEVTLRRCLRQVLDQSIFRQFEQIVGEDLQHQFASDAPFVKVWERAHNATRRAFKFVVAFVLEILRSTGVDRGNLQAWDITSLHSLDGRTIDTSWATMVQDDIGCATFAIITDNCIEYKDTPLETSYSRHQGLHSAVLSTKVYVTDDQTSKLDGWRNDPEGPLSQPIPQHDPRQISPNLNFGQWRTSNSLRQTESNDIRRIALIESAREWFGPDSAALSSIKQRQAARKEKRAASASIREPDPGSANQHEHRVHHIAGPPISQQNFAMAVCTSLVFKNGRGQYIGTLRLEPCAWLEQQQECVQITSPSHSSPGFYRWIAHKPGLLADLRQKEEEVDKCILDWAKNSRGLLPWMINLMASTEEPRPLVAEYIRGNLTEGQKVLNVYVR